MSDSHLSPNFDSRWRFTIFPDFSNLFAAAGWLTNEAMFSFKRNLIAIAPVLVSLTLFGCKTPKPGSAPVAPIKTAPTNAVPAEILTNHPALPPAALPTDSGDNMAPNILAWDATSREYHAKPGETNAPFTFSLTNVSSGPVVIYDTATTCDCTVANLPSKPWTVPSGGTGQIEATIDLRRKTGVVTNSIVVFTSQGNRRLNVKAFVAPSSSQ